MSTTATPPSDIRPGAGPAAAAPCLPAELLAGEDGGPTGRRRPPCGSRTGSGPIGRLPDAGASGAASEGP